MGSLESGPSVPPCLAKMPSAGSSWGPQPWSVHGAQSPGPRPGDPRDQRRKTDQCRHSEAVCHQLANVPRVSTAREGHIAENRPPPGEPAPLRGPSAQGARPCAGRTAQQSAPPGRLLTHLHVPWHCWSSTPTAVWGLVARDGHTPSSAPRPLLPVTASLWLWARAKPSVISSRGP